MRHRNPTPRGSRHTDQDEPQDTATRTDRSPESAALPPTTWLPWRWTGRHEQCRCHAERAADESSAVTAKDKDTEPLVLRPVFIEPSLSDRTTIPGYGTVAELVRRKPKPLWFAPQPLRLSAEESARTEQLVNDLLDTDEPSFTRPESPAARVLVGTLCTALMVGAAVATATLTGGVPPGDDGTARSPGPEAFAPGLAVEAERPAHPAAALIDPAAGSERAAVAAAREFYRRLDRSPELAERRLLADVPTSGRAPWRDVTRVRPLRVRADSAHQVLATVEVAHRDGSRSVLRQRLGLGATGRPDRIGVETLSLQHFPR
ncbi:hypothetical protein BJ969_005085 [Saccharopolyspora gloriosae]|uniref:Uncharacterized protein n=1 Tax=Saccharopolyspora gloriosae TaxID=455344 RepID=A0A840NV15_9PSEU|nr:hypothetical protein [Saccharopolyspora gloriosae]MBB5071997.1 hypothetical protein [Saccharopolyspora gloriosae]